MSTKITPEHLARPAYVYVRQSSQAQVRNHLEGRRRQYALQDHAKALGWSNVEVIDEDQGRSSSGTAPSGFDRLLAAVCEGGVGAVLALEVSRLARTGREWHALMEFCGIVGTLLVDEDGIYDPSLTNDRLVLGMKNTLAQMEISTFRQRSLEAIRLKASRGELFNRVAIGYVRGPNGNLQRDPDDRVRAAIELIFRKFAELGSIRQVMLWHREEAIPVPYQSFEAQERTVRWKLPVYNTMLAVLQNPVYAGAYTFRRRVMQTRLRDGRKYVYYTRQRDPDQWGVLIKDHHEDYISWDVFEHNQRTIGNNANMFGEPTQGSVRRGETLLAGLLRCGHCARRIKVRYGGHKVGGYACGGAKGVDITGTCIAFGALRVDAAVCEEVLLRLQPLGLEAALHAITTREQADGGVLHHLQLALEQARYEAALARRQYDAVDPSNRLVASELERRWNERLVTVADLEHQLTSATHASTPPLTEAERKQLLALGTDLQRAWYHPSASAETRKRILRTVIHEIVVHLEGDQIQLKLHWQGGDHTELVVRKNPRGVNRHVTPTDTVELIRALARLQRDDSIATFLNRLGKRTAKGLTWSETRVRTFRNDHKIAIYREGERAERGEVNLGEAAQLLQVNNMTVRRLIQQKILAAHQPCYSAPWIIRRSDLDLPAVRQALKSNLGNGPLTANPDQNGFEFQ